MGLPLLLPGKYGVLHRCRAGTAHKICRFRAGCLASYSLQGAAACRALDPQRGRRYARSPH
eukprot:508957-Karenia_brevis.AAC.1